MYLIKTIENQDVIFFKKVIVKGKKEREIYIIDDKSKILFKKINSELCKVYYNTVFMKENKDIRDIAHGFFKGRNPLTNAKAHKNYDVTISLDIKNHFSSINQKMVDEYLTAEQRYLCFINEILPQGLLTSPVISNLAMIKLDRKINYLLKKIAFGSNCQIDASSLFYASSVVKNSKIINYKYTRYVDDITISLNLNPELDKKSKKKLINDIINSVTSECNIIGFKINSKKTSVQLESNGFRIITGVAVSKSVIKASRKTKRKLRSAIYNARYNNAIGLFNWIDYIGR
ncbi:MULTISPECIES: reverse transcriptase family protein [unclassified Providencia]|uniref:reverse transcriptase family protein n=1 Tax=unclassified Providencia TaxID=2633465 RepID=UPI00234974D6|nr:MULTISPECIES: reverse transcriptase family protein [unclassified Providencia]WOB84881.1 reverse transcriptase family protein [Providencia sp. PROV040]